MNQKLGESIARKAAIEIFFCDPVPTWQQVMEQMEARLERGEGSDCVGSLLYPEPDDDLGIPTVEIWSSMSRMSVHEFSAAIEDSASLIESAIREAMHDCEGRG